jgi:DNA-binding GntR family transcriptional regulator
MVGLDRDSTVPLHRQLYEGLRGEILSGRLPAGSRLPSVRSLVREFGISRNTVTGALSQLSAEGYLEARVGSGTYVARSMPDELLRAGKLSKRLDRQTPMPGPSRRRPEKNPQERQASSVCVKEQSKGWQSLREMPCAKSCQPIGAACQDG